MKSFDELSQKELASLTDREIQNYKELLCAKAGIGVLPEIPSDLLQEMADLQKVTVYAFEGFCLKDQETVQKILEILQKADLYKLDWSSKLSGYSLVKHSRSSDNIYEPKMVIDMSSPYSIDESKILQRREMEKEIETLKKSRREIDEQMRNSFNKAFTAKNNAIQIELAIRTYANIVGTADQVFALLQTAYPLNKLADWAEYHDQDLEGCSESDLDIWIKETIERMMKERMPENPLY